MVTIVPILPMKPTIIKKKTKIYDIAIHIIMKYIIIK